MDFLPANSLVEAQSGSDVSSVDIESKTMMSIDSRISGMDATTDGDNSTPLSEPFLSGVVQHDPE